ncbi:hypothetical protein LEP1GSC021_4376 [Leptospira noguchii str. 1993005606]|nr:hypothetical protein LEP1GSC021_4376 [Leptospira noguchii str. 1993005606]
MLKNSIAQINKTTLVDFFYKAETDGELTFQQLYSISHKGFRIFDTIHSNILLF